MDLFDRLRQAVLEGDDIESQKLAQEAVDAGLPISKILQDSVMSGIKAAGDLWQKNEYFLPDMVMSAEAFRQAMVVLDPLISGQEQHPKGLFLIGTVAGDMHDLGKMIVSAMLRGAGFNVIDLGEDVPRQTFLETIVKLKPDILGLGCYMTTTMAEVAEIVHEVKSNSVQEKVAVMVGGVPTSQAFADEIGADGWGKDAIDTVEKSLALVRAK